MAPEMISPLARRTPPAKKASAAQPAPASRNLVRRYARKKMRKPTPTIEMHTPNSMSSAVSRSSASTVAAESVGSESSSPRIAPRATTATTKRRPLIGPNQLRPLSTAHSLPHNPRHRDPYWKNSSQNGASSRSSNRDERFRVHGFGPLPELCPPVDPGNTFPQAWSRSGWQGVALGHPNASSTTAQTAAIPDDLYAVSCLNLRPGRYALGHRR